MSDRSAPFWRASAGMVAQQMPLRLKLRQKGKQSSSVVKG
jgi:hypothetical protein